MQAYVIMSGFDHETDGTVETRSREDVKRPRRFKVLLHNDHYTSMEFVVMILETVFRKSPPESLEIMLSVHQQGVGLAGVFPAAVAETKIKRVHVEAEDQGFPLKCSMEPE